MELKTLFTTSSAPLSGDAIIRDLKSNGFLTATMRPPVWESGQEQCSIFYDLTNSPITVSDTTNPTGGRVIVLHVQDSLASDAVKVVIETVMSELGASEIAGQ